MHSTRDSRSTRGLSATSRRRLRTLAVIGLVGGLALGSSACSSDKDKKKKRTSASQNKGGLPFGGAKKPRVGGADTDANAVDPGVVSTIAGLKVCDLVNLDKIKVSLSSPGYVQPPTDVQKGAGTDPGGPQCTAQFTMPEPEATSGVTQKVPAARINVSVVAFESRQLADQQYQARIAQARIVPESMSQRLTGGRWERGEMITARSSEDTIMALAQKGNYLVKIRIGTPSERTFQLPVSQVRVRQAVNVMIRNDLYPGVERALTR